MDEWKPAGQIDGLFERKSAPAESKPAPVPLAAPAPPQQQTSRQPATQKVAWPGARRRSLLLVALILPLVWHFALEAISPLLIKQFGRVLMEKVLSAATFVPLVVLLHFTLQRLVNLGMSRLWVLAVFAPILNFWLGYRCFACPAGYAYHKKLDGPGIVLTVLYWLVVLAAIASLFSGAFDASALQEQLRGLIRTARGLIPQRP